MGLNAFFMSFHAILIFFSRFSYKESFSGGFFGGWGGSEDSQ